MWNLFSKSGSTRDFTASESCGTFQVLQLERLKKNCSQCGARIFGFWRGFGEGAGWKPPVTEPKRSQKPKRPLLLPSPHLSQPRGYSFFENALKPTATVPGSGQSILLISSEPIVCPGLQNDGGPENIPAIIGPLPHWQWPRRSPLISHRLSFLHPGSRKVV